MEIGTAEISRIIKEQIRDYEKTVEVQEIGTVLSTGDGIARIYGLDRVAAAKHAREAAEHVRRADQASLFEVAGDRADARALLDDEGHRLVVAAAAPPEGPGQGQRRDGSERGGADEQLHRFSRAP